MLLVISLFIFLFVFFVHFYLKRYQNILIPPVSFILLVSILTFIILVNLYHTDLAIFFCLLNTSLALSYMLFFVGVVHNSPSLLVSIQILENKSNMNKEDLISFLSKKYPMVEGRLENMISHNFAKKQGARLKLTWRGKCLFSINQLYKIAANLTSRTG